MIELRPFQRTFLRRAFAPGTETAVYSAPRGNGKSFLGSQILARCMTPGDPLHQPGKEYLFVSGGGLEQAARGIFRPVRETLEPTGEYRFVDAITRLGVTHRATNTRARGMSSSGKAAMGIVGVPLVVFDEPGAGISVSGSELLHDAIETAQGKPGSPLRAIYLGTLAPATGGWWHDMVERGSHGSVYVQKLQGDPAKWDQWPEIRRCNPLCNISPSFRRKLLEERDAARADSRLKARFLSYRLNLPTSDESKVLVTVDDWDRVCERAVPERSGRPVVSVDLAGGRAWSGAVAIWENGRCEALAVAPGIPPISDQEKRDRVPRGTYQRLVDEGLLVVAEGLRVQPPAMMVEKIISTWGLPVRVVCDRFRLAELQDAAPPGLPIEPRRTRWSESSEDIRALRAMAKDGPLAVPESSRLLLAWSISQAMVKSDDAGGVRLVKRDGTNNTARDDVAAALVLGAGLFQRAARRPRARWRYRGAA